MILQILDPIGLSLGNSGAKSSGMRWFPLNCSKIILVYQPASCGTQDESTVVKW